MKRPFGMLMDILDDKLFTNVERTLGELSTQYDEPVERIMDALEAIKERRGEKSYWAAPCEGDCCRAGECRWGFKGGPSCCSPEGV